MSKVYIARHQSLGFLTEYPFASYPSAEQLAALEKLCFRSAGATHPKTKEPYWLKVAELDLLGEEIPSVPEPLASVSVGGSAAVGQFGVSAVGEVRNPKK